MKPQLLDMVGVMLLRHGYTVRTLTRTSFDIAARNQASIILLKVVEDASALNQAVMREMLQVSSTVAAVPVIIAEKAGQPLTDNVIYTRFHVYLLTPNTLANCLENKLPFLFSTNAGPSAAVIGEKLRCEREEHGLSLNALAQKIGVSSTMIRRYEANDAMISAKTAEVLYDIFGGKVFRRIRVFEHQLVPHPNAQSSVGKKYETLGFDTVETRRAPFDMVAKKKEEVIITDVSDKVNPQLHAIARLLGADQLTIFEKHKPKKTPALAKKEFMDFDDADELIKFVREFEQ